MLLPLAGCAVHQPGAEYLPEPIKPYLATVKINAKQQEAIDKYRALAGHKALVVSESGHFGYSWDGKSSASVAKTALYWCQHYATDLCRIHLADEGLYQDEYAEFARRSAAAIANMKVPAPLDYNLEAIDWGIPAPTEVRPRSIQPYERQTPVALTGIRTIKTVDVARMLMMPDKPILIDAHGWMDARPSTIPGALNIDWVGTEEAHIPGREDQMRKIFGNVMQQIAPDRAQPVIVFCQSTICWLSVNAAIRLQALGYTNVYWYRGGKESWVSAGLPLIASVPHATIWLPK